jgi:hypothetical protein
MAKQENRKLYRHLAARSKGLTLWPTSVQHSFRQDNASELARLTTAGNTAAMKNLQFLPACSLACCLLVIV